MADQRRETHQRPSPDALLAKASKEESRAGRLKVFLGAAPGVGKTYEMLQEVRARLKEGKDVVIGVVETQSQAQFSLNRSRCEFGLPTQMLYSTEAVVSEFQNLSN
jgi:two-component system sensor histidine kinase KdpD